MTESKSKGLTKVTLTGECGEVSIDVSQDQFVSLSDCDFLADRVDIGADILADVIDVLLAYQNKEPLKLKSKE